MRLPVRDMLPRGKIRIEDLLFHCFCLSPVVRTLPLGISDGIDQIHGFLLDLIPLPLADHVLVG